MEMITKPFAAGGGRPAHLLTVLVGALAVAFAFTGSAAAFTPTGEYSNFAHCAFKNAATFGCLYAKTTSGEFDIGSTDVPLSKAITLQGGVTEANSANVSEILAAEGAETLSKTPETVPGGLFKIVAPESWPGWVRAIFNEFVNQGLTGVTATTEVVGTPKLSSAAALTGSGTALELPTRVHLENAFLGSECYVGSRSKPVVVDFTTGTTSPPAPNKPISGSAGELEFKGEGQIVVLKNNSLVNNSFSAPEAEGCGGFLLSWAVDPAVDAEVGLPSAAGHNTAILNGTQELASRSAVEAH